MKHYIRYIYTSLVSFGSLMLLVLALGLSSCATDDSEAPFQKVSSDSTVVSLTFFINDGARTRAINTANEDNVSDITVLVFDNSGSLIGSKYLSSVAAGTVDIPVSTRSATGCTVYAIANTGPDGCFAGVNTIDQLNAKYTTISSASALESDGSTTGSTGALIVGKASADITTGGANQFPVTLYHQCGKVTFTITPDSGVTIIGYQLCNVPLSSYITDSHVPALASTVAGPPAGTGSYGNFDAVSGLCQTTALSKTYYVYENLCGSNSNDTTEMLRNSSNVPVSASASASYLLVTAVGSGWISTYKIYLGGVTNTATPTTDLTNFNVYRNLNYQCSISLGANGGNGYARVSYTATSTRSNMCMGDATVGNYLYDDGTNGTVYNPSHTVGIIYSNQVTLAQYNAGCRHGRVMALKNAYNNFCPWSNTGTSSPYSDRITHPYVTAPKDFFEDVSSGYDALSVNSSYVNSSSNSAWYYCINYKDGTSRSNTAPFRNTGWFLPSSSDWWDIMENLGNWATYEYTLIKRMRTKTAPPRVAGLPDLIDQLTSNYFNRLNTKLLTANGDIITPSSSACYFWSASEYNSSLAVIIGFNTLNVYLSRNRKTTNNYYYARAVLAY